MECERCQLFFGVLTKIGSNNKGLDLYHLERYSSVSVQKNDFFHLLLCSFFFSDQQYQSSKLWRYYSWRLPFLWVLWHFIWTRSWKCSRMSRKMHFSKIVSKILQVFWILWQQGTYSITTLGFSALLFDNI